MDAAPFHAVPLHDAARNLYIVPVRHHSPACAAHLERLIAAVSPAAILVEGPCDFDALIPLVCDARTMPPVAIVAMREGEHAGAPRRVASYFPFCAHSPEYIALRSAADRGIAARFIDLPSHAREMAFNDQDQPDRSLLGDERAFDVSDYVTALARTLGCRDGNEVWDQLFEARIADEDWGGFFADVGQYCACIRAASDADSLQRDGTLAREAQMRALIAETRAETAGPIVIIVGGFHAAALFDEQAKPVKIKQGVKGKASGYLIRYGHRQLNALSGYAAGLPLPGYYERLWQARQHGLDGFALDLITGFAAHLRTGAGEAPSCPVVANAAEQAERLAVLRGRPFPARDDIIDAVRSSFIKDEIPANDVPLLAELAAWLTGSAMGDVPPSAGSPPLVEAAREQARTLGFSVSDGERRSRELDIYRRDRHRAASRFCHGMTLIGSGFARRTAGPDFRNDVGLDRLHEIWSTCWSPQVEARLIEISEVADTLPEALMMTLAEQLAALEAAGRGRNALVAIDLYATACRAGIGDKAGPVLELIEADIIEDPELASVAAALTDLVLLRRGREQLDIIDSTQLDRLIGTCWRRVLLLLPDLADISDDEVRPAIQALAHLRGTMELARSSDAPIDIAQFDEALARLRARALTPMLCGAVIAFAMIHGQADAHELEQRLRGELASGYDQPHQRLAFLAGVILIARELLWAVPSIIAVLEDVIAAANDDDFIALLPHLRMALMPLDPREVDRLGEAVARRIGVAPDGMAVQFAISENDMLANLALDRELDRWLARDGLDQAQFAAARG